MHLSHPAEQPRNEIWEAVLEQRPRALRVALARCASADEAEEIVQEALMRVAGMADLDLGRVGPLISVVVANLATDGYRRRTRTVALETKLRRTRLEEPGHDDEVCDRLEARWLRSHLSDLPPQERRTLEMRASGMGVSDIAVARGVSYKAAESALGRARNQMRAIWRAAGSLIGALLGVRRLVPPAKVALPAVATTALAACIWTFAVSQAGPPARAGGVPDRHPEALSAEIPTAAPVVTSSARLTVAIKRRAAAAQPVQIVRSVQATPPLRAPGVVDYGGARVEHRPHGETPMQTVQRCLRHVTVTPSHVECDG